MIDTRLLEEISVKVEQAGTHAETVAKLRVDYPGIHFTYCMDDDIHSARPALSRPAFNLYLVDGSEHCLSLTTDPQRATGVVLAEIVDDD